MKLSHIGLAVLAMAVWGFNFVAISLGLTELPPFLFTGLRFVATVIPFIFFVRKPEISWKLIFAVGFFLLTLQFAFLFKGIQMGVGGGIASTVIQCQAFFTLIFGANLLREAPTIRDISGLAVAGFGILLIGLSMGRASAIGLFTIVLAGACWAVGNIFLKKVGKVDMMALIIYASLFPPIPLFVLSYAVEGPEKIIAGFEAFSWISGFSLVYIVLVSTLFSYSVWGFLMKNYESRQVAPFGLLVPIFGIFSGWLVLNEEFAGQKLFGAALVIFGLVVVNWRALAPYIKRAVDKQTTF